MQRIINLLVLVFLSVSVLGQNAFRKGFYFSVGIGPSVTNYKLDGSFTKPNNATLYYGSNWLGDIYSDGISGDLELYPFKKTSMGLRTNFNIGYGISNQIVISYMNKVSYVLDDILHQTNYISHYQSPPALTVAGVTGIECNYYLSEEIKSPYFSFGGGLSLLNQPGVSDYLTQTGFGLSFGGGYQFTKRLCVDLNILYLQGNLRKKIKDEIENLNSGVSIDGSFRAISAGLSLKFVLF